MLTRNEFCFQCFKEYKAVITYNRACKGLISDPHSRYKCLWFSHPFSAFISYSHLREQSSVMLCGELKVSLQAHSEVLADGCLPRCTVHQWGAHAGAQCGRYVCTVQRGVCLCCVLHRGLVAYLDGVLGV